MKTTTILKQIKTTAAKTIFFVVVFCLFFGMLTNTVLGQNILVIFNRSPAAIEYGFDLMETFDDIQDWQGSQRSEQAHNGIMSSDYPKRLDGSDTPLNIYDYWVSTDPGDDFIKDHRDNGGKIWDPKGTGTGKSLCMDISHRGLNGLGNGMNWGPSRFGTYFGSIDGVNGDHTHGYREMYVFFMVFIENNQWPTERNSETNVGEYVEGDPLLYIASWKFITMGQGFKEPWIHWQGPGSRHDPEYTYAKSTYGWHYNVVHFKPHNNQPELRYGDIGDYLYLQTNPEAPCISESRGGQSTAYTNEAIPKGQWIGVEMRYVLNSRGNDDGSEQLWWYEPDGTVHQLSQNFTDLWLQSTCEYDNGDKMNMFLIGGNNSNTYLWGDSMEPRYYVDDFIINGSRIGPSYFSQLSSYGINEPGMVDKFDLSQNYPNPFNPSTTIKYSVTKPCNAQIKIYNRLGQEVYALVNERKSAGEHNVTWNGKDAKGNKLASGIYYYRLTAGKQVDTKKMIYLR